MNHRHNLFPTGNHVIDTLSVAPSCGSLPDNINAGSEINMDLFIAILLQPRSMRLYVIIRNLMFTRNLTETENSYSNR